MNNLIFVRRALYKLKREFGIPADIYKIVSAPSNLETGVKTVSKVRYHVNKAVLLPSTLSTKFQYDLSYISANKNFTYGGFYDQRLRNFIFDARDLPKTLVIASEDFIVAKHKKYQVIKVEELEESQGYLIAAQQLLGEKIYEFHELSVHASIRFQQTAVRVP